MKIPNEKAHFIETENYTFMTQLKINFSTFILRGNFVNF